MIKQGIECDKFLNIIAHQRSGHHGVMHWLFCQLPQPSAFLHHPGSKPAWFNGNKFLNTQLEEKPVVLGLNLEGGADLIYKQTMSDPKLIIVRDVKNLVVSLAKLRGNARIHRQAFKAMENYTTFAIDKTVQKSCNAAVVNYHKWHLSKEYRKEIFKTICDLIGIEAEFTDAGKNFVMGSGGGSSFTKQTLTADKMDVLNRYKMKGFDEVLSRIPDRLLRFNEMYFGDIYD